MTDDAARVDAPLVARADSLAALPSPVDLDPDWDDAFGWSHGRAFWNVGCG